MHLHNTQTENTSLKDHIATLERHLHAAQADQDRLTAAHRTVTAQHTRDNTALRAQLAALRGEHEGIKKDLGASEQALGRASAALALAQDEGRRLKHQVVQLEHTASQLRVQNRYDRCCLCGHGWDGVRGCVRERVRGNDVTTWVD